MVDQIPDDDGLFRRIHVQFTRGRKARANPSYISPSGFSFSQDGCSVFWERFVNEEDVRNSCLELGKKKIHYGILKLLAGKVRNQENLDVKHDPTGNFRDYRCNKAHSLIISNSIISKNCFYENEGNIRR